MIFLESPLNVESKNIQGVPLKIKNLFSGEAYLQKISHQMNHLSMPETENLHKCPFSILKKFT